MRNNLLPVAKEGWSFVLSAVLVFFLFTILDLEFLAFMVFLATLFFLFVYRNPERLVPIYQEKSVVSPVDGVVLSIEELKESEYAYKIEINTTYTDVSVLRVPFTSKIKEFTLTHGTRISRFNKLSKKLNENLEITFEDESKNSLKISHMLQQSFDGIKIDILKQQKFQQGARYGVMLHGITTIYLPQNFRLNINVGNQIKASESLLGYFS